MPLRYYPHFRPARDFGLGQHRLGLGTIAASFGRRLRRRLRFASRAGERAATEVCCCAMMGDDAAVATIITV